MLKIVMRIAVGATITLVQPAQAHPWTQASGHGQGIFTWSDYRTQEVFSEGNAHRALPNQGEFRKQQVRLFFEQAIVPDLTALLKLEPTRARYSDQSATQTNEGVADPELGLRYAVQRQGEQNLLAVGVQGIVKAGIGKKSGQPAVDAHQTDFEVRLAVGQSTTFGYWAWDVGARFRLGPPADELRSDAVLGLNCATDTQILGELFLTLGLGNPSGTGSSTDRAADYDLAVTQLSVVHRLSPRIRVQAGGFAHAFGRSTGAGVGGLLALWWNW